MNGSRKTGAGVDKKQFQWNETKKINWNAKNILKYLKIITII